MNWTESQQAIIEAKETLRRAEYMGRDISNLIKNQLRNYEISGDVLNAFKSELKDWNMNTMAWKDRK